MQFSCEMKVEEIVDFFFVFPDWVFFLLSKFDFFFYQIMQSFDDFKDWCLNCLKSALK